MNTSLSVKIGMCISSRRIHAGAEKKSASSQNWVDFNMVHNYNIWPDEEQYKLREHTRELKLCGISDPLK